MSYWSQEVFSHVEASSNNGQSVSTSTNTTVIYEDESVDVLGEYNPATGEFTALHAGDYKISAQLTFAGSSWNAMTVCTLRIVVDSTTIVIGPQSYAYVATSELISCFVNKTVSLSAGEVLTIVVRQSSGSTKTLQTDGTLNFLSIDSLPGRAA